MITDRGQVSESNPSTSSSYHGALLPNLVELRWLAYNLDSRVTLAMIHCIPALGGPGLTKLVINGHWAGPQDAKIVHAMEESLMKMVSDASVGALADFLCCLRPLSPVDKEGMASLRMTVVVAECSSSPGELMVASSVIRAVEKLLSF